jgi:multiple sugar transport system permease protein
MKHSQRMRGKAPFYWAIFAPALFVLVLLTVYPILNVAITSFQNYNYLTGVRRWTGIDNYVSILSDKVFLRAFLNTIVYCLGTTICEVGLGIILALVFFGEFRGKSGFMIMAIFPMMLSTMVVCAVWKTLYHYDIGLFNYVLNSLGLGRVGWLIDKDKALLSLAIVDIWQWTPFAFIVMQAGLSSVPTEIFEASMIDGANYRQTVFRVTLPILKDQVFLLLLLRAIDTFKIFAKVMALTRGGPGNATETTSFFIYREAFSYFKLGRSSAASVITLVTVALASVYYLRKILKEA